MSRWRSATRTGLAAMVTAAAACAGCASDPSAGYSLSNSFATDIETVSVPMFGNESFHRGLEVELTDAIIKQIQRTTAWRVTPGDTGEATLRGTIRRVELETLSTTRNVGLAEEIAVRIQIDFDFVDNRTGRPILERREFTASETFVPAQGLGERIEVGENGAVQELARDVVHELRSKW